MRLPSKLKNMNFFDEGQTYRGLIGSVTLPKLGRKLEDFRAGGMDVAVGIDMGGENLELEWSVGGLLLQALKQFGMVGVAGVMMRFAGAYQAEDTGLTTAVEVVVRGRHEEIDMGEAKVGEDTEQKVKSRLAYYKLTIDGVDVIEIDILNMIFIVDGVDRLADQRAAIGV